MHYAFDWGPVLAHAGLLASGLALTVALSAAGLFGALLLGVPIGTAGASGVPALRRGAVAYVEAVRNIPLLLHIYFWFLGLSALDLPAFLCATLGLSIYSGAYAAEIVRAGLLAVPPGQRDAARALGLGPWRTLRLVVYPQALRIVGPSLASLFSQLIKDSSLASVVAVGELTYEASSVEADTFRSFEIYTTVAVLYLALVTLVGRAVRTQAGAVRDA